MALAQLDGVALSYDDRGHGEPVLLIHAGVLADWFSPLLDRPLLIDRFRLIGYHRVNYGRSSQVEGPVSVGAQAEQARELLRYLGVGRAHVVGHSAGAAIALQFARDCPEMIQTLTVMDPSLPGGPPPPDDGDTLTPTLSQRERGPRGEGPSAVPPFMQQALDLLEIGRPDQAVDAFMRNVCGPSYRAVVDVVLPPGAFEQAIADAEGLFRQEIPALLAWRFGPEDARRIACPALVVAGAESPPVFAERQRKLLNWLPHAEPFTLPGAGHLLHLEQPRAFAEGLAAFLARHPMSA